MAGTKRWPAGELTAAVLLNSASERADQAACQGQRLGRWRCRRRAEVAIRAGTAMSLRRMVAGVGFGSAGVLVRVAAARVRLKAITAQTSQAALAVKTPEGRWASAEALRSAWTFSMIACRRWV